MQNSRAYIDFMKQTKAVGREKMEGYNPSTLEKIYDWEREEIEDTIWNYFVNKNDSDLAIFMPKLKKYNGMEALEDKLNIFNVPSCANVNVAEALYITMGQKKYLDLLIENYNKSENKTPIVARVMYLAKNNDVYSWLMDIYVNDTDGKNQICALSGILWRDGFIKNINDMQEFSKKIQFLRLFKSDNREKRREILNEYKNGAFESYKM